MKIIHGVIALILLLPLGAHAVPITGQGLPTDYAALSSGTVIDFESTGVVNTASLTIDNVTFTGNALIQVDNDYAGGYNTRGDYHITNHGNEPTKFRFDFASQVDAFAFLWGAADVDWVLSAFNGNSLLETLVVNPTSVSNAGDYFGIASAGITHATLEVSSGSDYVFLDNFTYSPGIASVPEPGVIYLFGLGLAGIGFMRKKKQSDNCSTDNCSNIVL